MHSQPETSRTVLLSEIAHARSGDKGNHANVGVIAWTEAGYDFLQQVLTPEAVEQYFAPLSPTRVQRFAMPGIKAHNFLLHNVLAGGASRSLRTDSQGKTLASALLQIPIPAPKNLEQMRRP